MNKNMAEKHRAFRFDKQVFLYILLTCTICPISLNFGEIGENSRKFRKLRGTQWNSVGFCMELSMNSVGTAGKYRGNARFSRKIWDFGVVSGGFKAIFRR